MGPSCYCWGALAQIKPEAAIKIFKPNSTDAKVATVTIHISSIFLLSLLCVRESWGRGQACQDFTALLFQNDKPFHSSFFRINKCSLSTGSIPLTNTLSIMSVIKQKLPRSHILLQLLPHFQVPLTTKFIKRLSPAPNPSKHQGLFKRVNSLHEVAKSIGASASASVLPMNIQDWFPSGLTGLISLQSKGLSRVFSNSTVQKHQFFGTQLSLWSNCHIHTWLLEKTFQHHLGRPQMLYSVAKYK